jgi:hypothetical protein
MRAEDLVFWIDSLPDPIEPGAAVLCLRHADSMVVPRGWTLDDLREPVPRLFRPPLPAPKARSRAAGPVHVPKGGEQLRLDSDDALVVELRVHAEVVDDGEVVDDAEAGPWTPSFDEADDLDGLLSARSPLLARAFRTADRRVE